MPKFNISFKQTKKDMELFLKIMEQEEKSEFVKGCIRFYLEKNKKGKCK